MSDVDFILNNWFGEPPEHSDNERARIRHLYKPLREIERQRDVLLTALKLVAAQDQGCGGNVSEAEAWQSAQHIARAAIKAVEK